MKTRLLIKRIVANALTIESATAGDDARMRACVAYEHDINEVGRRAEEGDVEAAQFERAWWRTSHGYYEGGIQ